MLGLAGAWSFGALFYGTDGQPWLAALLLAVLAGLAMQRPRGASVLAWALYGAVLGWWLTLSPSNDRDWEPEYAVQATVRRDGDRIVLSGIRNAAYLPDGVVRPAYYDAEFRLDQLDEVDLVVSHWSGDAIAHVFLSFGFSGRHVAISVETRRERGEAYSALAGFFRRYELMYVVADERDLIGVRTDIKRERVYLYRIESTPQERQALLLRYLGRIARLASSPEFYNTLVDNCTTNVFATGGRAPRRAASSWMLILSGYADRYSYEHRRLNVTLPFETLKQRSLVQRPPNSRIGPDYSAEIRRDLPGWTDGTP